MLRQHVRGVESIPRMGASIGAWSVEGRPFGEVSRTTKVRRPKKLDIANCKSKRKVATPILLPQFVLASPTGSEIANVRRPSYVRSGRGLSCCGPCSLCDEKRRGSAIRRMLDMANSIDVTLLPVKEPGFLVAAGGNSAREGGVRSMPLWQFSLI